MSVTDKPWLYIAGRAAFNISLKGHFFMKNSTFFEKRAPKISPYSVPFLIVLHQIKALYNFRKKGRLSIVERKVDLKYALYRFLVKT